MSNKENQNTNRSKNFTWYKFSIELIKRYLNQLVFIELDGIGGLEYNSSRLHKMLGILDPRQRQNYYYQEHTWWQNFTIKYFLGVKKEIIAFEHKSLAT